MFGGFFFSLTTSTVNIPSPQLTCLQPTCVSLACTEPSTSPPFHPHTHFILPCSASGTCSVMPVYLPVPAWLPHSFERWKTHPHCCQVWHSPCKCNAVFCQVCHHDVWVKETVILWVLVGECFVSAVNNITPKMLIQYFVAICVLITYLLSTAVSAVNYCLRLLCSTSKGNCASMCVFCETDWAAARL